jgi:hypothetical protein
MAMVMTSIVATAIVTTSIAATAIMAKSTVTSPLLHFRYLGTPGQIAQVVYLDFRTCSGSVPDRSWQVVYPGSTWNLGIWRPTLGVL